MITNTSTFIFWKNKIIWGNINFFKLMKYLINKRSNYWFLNLKLVESVNKCWKLEIQINEIQKFFTKQLIAFFKTSSRNSHIFAR